MDCHLTEMEMHSHIAPLTRLGGVRLCVLDGRQILLDRMKIARDKTELIATAVDEMFPKGDAERNQVLQIVLGYDEGSLLVVAYKRLRLAVFHSRASELDNICRSAHRVIQELCESYERAGDRFIQSYTFGERHRALPSGKDDVALMADEAMETREREPVPFPPRPSHSRGRDEEELQTVPIRPSQGRLGSLQEGEE